METARHLVARQTIEVIASDRAACETLAARTSGAAGRLAAAVEAGLDSIDSAGVRLQLDRVELDLGTCDPARWEDALADGIRLGLAPKVVEAVNRAGSVRGDALSSALLILEEFARCGRLPWWSSAADTPASAIASLTAAGCEPRAVRAMLVRPEAIERFIQQLDEVQLSCLLQLARPDLGRDAAASTLALARPSLPVMPAAAGTRATRADVWRAILAEAAVAPADGAVEPRPDSDRSDSASAGTRQFRAAVAARLGIEGPGRATEAGPGGPHPAILDRTVAASSDSAGIAGQSDERSASLSVRLRELALDMPFASALLARLAALAAKLDGSSVAAAESILERDTGPLAMLGLISLFTDADLVSAGDADHWRNAVIAAIGQAKDEAHDAIAVTIAGLPLVWPFVQAFFEDLELLDGDRFRDPAAQHRGAALLHHIATGEFAGPEHDLPLAKVFTGIDLDAVHDPGEPLDDTEIDHAAALLQAVLGHAPMLGLISVAALREAFLTRPGLLSTRDGHWLLRVERRSFDILLDRLPWTLAWVRLPWMAAPLRVEW